MTLFAKNLIACTARLQTITESEVGGKGWNLFRLRHFGFPVPKWLVVSSALFDQVLSYKRKPVGRILNDIDFTNRKSVEAASSRIIRLILESRLPDDFIQQLSETMSCMFPQTEFFSVRSSVIGEDSAENSFAGQMDSFLNVHPKDVPEAIKKVWASSFSSRALIYRHKKGIDPSDISTAVIIQEMVQSRASGILFTRHPESKEKTCVISAGFGLGEGVVSNAVETDTYQVDWALDKISREVSKKNEHVILAVLERGGTQVRPVPAALRSQPVLTDAQVLQLGHAGVRAEKCFGMPLDIEWAFDNRMQLHILQARPIVFASPGAPQTSKRIWDNSNIVESYPGLTLPLTFSFVRNGYEKSLRRAALSFLLSEKAMGENLPIFRNMVGLLNGRVYYNLLNWYRMLSYLPGFRKYKQSWDRMIGISEKLDYSQNRLSLPNRFYSLLKVGRVLLFVRHTAKKFFAHFNPVYEKYRNIETSTADPDSLISVYDSLERELMEKWHLTLLNDFCAFKYYDWLRALCSKWGLEKYPNLHNNLLCGQSGVESVAPVRSLVRLAEMFRAEPDYRSLISENDDQAAWEKIRRESRYTKLKGALDLHLQLYGDRGAEELKLEQPTFREEPAKLIGLIRAYYQRGLTVEAMEQQERRVRREAEETVRRHLRNPLKQLVFRFVLRNARKAIANRENMRFARTRAYGIARRLFRRIADIFVEEGLLESSSDIFYLTVDEVFGTVQGTTVTQNLKAIVELRRSEYAQFARCTPKERVETAGIPRTNPLCEIETCNFTGKKLRGTGCSSGTAVGNARVISDPRSSIASGDCILVAKSTDPGWVFLMVSSRGIVVEKGSVLSHTAIIGRELGIPTIVGVKNATSQIPDGAHMSMNGSTGEITWQ